MRLTLFLSFILVAQITVAQDTEKFWVEHYKVKKLETVECKINKEDVQVIEAPLTGDSKCYLIYDMFPLTSTEYKSMASLDEDELVRIKKKTAKSKSCIAYIDFKGEYQMEYNDGANPHLDNIWVYCIRECK